MTKIIKIYSKIADIVGKYVANDEMTIKSTPLLIEGRATQAKGEVQRMIIFESHAYILTP